MTKALKEEVEKLENEENAAAENEVIDDYNINSSEDIAKNDFDAESSDNDDVSDQGDDSENKEDVIIDADNDEEQEKERKKEEYRRRVQQKKEQSKQASAFYLQQQSFDEQQASQSQENNLTDDDRELLQQLRQERDRQIRALQLEQGIQAGKRELEGYEKEYIEIFPEYKNDVEMALDFTKLRLVNSGMSEQEAQKQVEREKVLLADRAVAQGRDPVEAIHDEAKQIVKTFEAFSEQIGYTKNAAKTNLQAIREAAKPNAMSGGAGKGSSAVKRGFDDLEHDELDNLTFGQMRAMKEKGEF